MIDKGTHWACVRTSDRKVCTATIAKTSRNSREALVRLLCSGMRLALTPAVISERWRQGYSDGWRCVRVSIVAHMNFGDLS